jgi:hypothetical protein
MFVFNIGSTFSSMGADYLLEELGISEEELEEIALSMKGYLKPETIGDFILLCWISCIQHFRNNTD